MTIQGARDLQVFNTSTSQPFHPRDERLIQSNALIRHCKKIAVGRVLLTGKERNSYSKVLHRAEDWNKVTVSRYDNSRSDLPRKRKRQKVNGQLYVNTLLFKDQFTRLLGHAAKRKAPQA